METTQGPDNDNAAHVNGNVLRSDVGFALALDKYAGITRGKASTALPSKATSGFVRGSADNVYLLRDAAGSVLMRFMYIGGRMARVLTEAEGREALRRVRGR